MSDDAPKAGVYPSGVQAHDVWDALAEAIPSGKVPGGSLAQLARETGVPAPTVRSIWRRHFQAHYPEQTRQRKLRETRERRSTKSRQPRTRDVGPTVPAPPVGAPVRRVQATWADLSLAMRERLAMMVELDMAQLQDVRQMVREGVPVATAKEQAGKGYSHTIAQSTIPAAVAWDKAQLEGGKDSDRVVVLNSDAAANEIDDGGIWEQNPPEPDDISGDEEGPALQVV